VYQFYIVGEDFFDTVSKYGMGMSAAYFHNFQGFFELVTKLGDLVA
jgi:hypothetical protein